MKERFSKATLKAEIERQMKSFDRMAEELGLRNPWAKADIFQAFDVNNGTAQVRTLRFTGAARDELNRLYGAWAALRALKEAL